jgi:hypothetical protein
MYLSSHVSQLDKGKKVYLNPFNPFGKLDKAKLPDLVSLVELREIQNNVLEIINRRREQKFVIKDGKLAYSVSEDEDKVNFIPLRNFRYMSKEGQENAIKLIKVACELWPENVSYLTYLIRLYNDVLYSRDVPQKFKRLFVNPLDCDIEHLPDFVKNMDDRDPVKQMFIEGLKAPPETIMFYFKSYLTKEQKEHKDRFRSRTRLVTTEHKPEFLDSSKQAVEIKINFNDPAYIASVEKRFKELCSESVNYG